MLSKLFPGTSSNTYSELLSFYLVAQDTLELLFLMSIKLVRDLKN